MHYLVTLAKSAVENYIKDYNPRTGAHRAWQEALASRPTISSHPLLGGWAPGKIISPPKDLSEEFLKRQAGTFVTIEENGKLRGCIGTYLPTRPNIAEEIIQNAIAAATKDYRFGPIQDKELISLSYTVYILSEPELVKEISELNPKKFGIIVKTTPIGPFDKTDVVFDGHLPPKSGLLLPDLKGIDTIEEQISIACQKGGIDPEREKIFIYRFSVEKYG